MMVRVIHGLYFTSLLLSLPGTNPGSYRRSIGICRDLYTPKQKPTTYRVAHPVGVDPCAAPSARGRPYWGHVPKYRPFKATEHQIAKRLGGEGDDHPGGADRPAAILCVRCTRKTVRIQKANAVTVRMHSPMKIAKCRASPTSAMHPGNSPDAFADEKHKNAMHS